MSDFCERPSCSVKFKHVHCSWRKPNGKKCGYIASTDPCGLCKMRGPTQSVKKEEEEM